MKRLVASVVVLSAVASSFGAASAELDLVLKSEKSVLWQTARSSTLEVPIGWPGDAASAELLVVSGGVTNAVPVESPETTSVQLAVVKPVADGDEAVLDLTLRYLTSSGSELKMERRTARIAVVRGVDGETAATYRGSDPSAAGFGNFDKAKRAVLPLPPFGAEGAAPATIAIDGGEPVDLSDAGFWQEWRGFGSGAHRLVLKDADGETLFDREVYCVPKGMILIFK